MVLDVSHQPKYNPDSSLWEARAKRRIKEFDQLPLDQKDWNAFVSFTVEYQEAVKKQKGTSELTWQEIDIVHREGIRTWNELAKDLPEDKTPDVGELIETVKKKLQKLYRIGDWT